MSEKYKWLILSIWFVSFRSNYIVADLEAFEMN